MFDLLILAQEMPAIPDTDAMSGSQIAIIIGVLVYLIKELFSFIKTLLADKRKSLEDKEDAERRKKYTGEFDRRKPDPNAIAAHQMMMEQHERMISALDHQATTLSGISGEVNQIKAITKSTSSKATDIKQDVSQIKSDVKSIDGTTDEIQDNTKLILDRFPRRSP